MRRLALAVAIVAFASARDARADEDRKNRWHALAYSLGGTATSFLVALAGDEFVVVGSSPTGRPWMQDFGNGLQWTALASLAITPSFGEWYAGDYLPVGLVVRTSGFALGALFLARAQANGCNRYSCWPADATIELVLGFGALAAGTVWDIATAPRAADRYNAKHAWIAITPMIAPAATGHAFGLGVAGGF